MLLICYLYSFDFVWCFVLSFRLVSSRLASVQLRSVRLGSVGFGLVWFGSVRSAHPSINSPTDQLIPTDQLTLSTDRSTHRPINLLSTDESTNLPTDESERTGQAKDPSREEWGTSSVEFCGGTHVSNTREAEAFVITEETAVAKGVRRVRGGSCSCLCFNAVLVVVFVIVFD